MNKISVGLMLGQRPKYTKLKKELDKCDLLSHAFESRNYNALNDLLRDYKPQLLIIDVSYIGSHGFNGNLKGCNKTCRILLLANKQLKEIPCLSIGYSIMFLERVAVEFSRAVDSIAHGEVYTSAIMAKVYDGIRDKLVSPSQLGLKVDDVACIEYLRQGLSHKDIANRLSKSVSAIESKIGVIVEKMGINNRGEILEFVSKQHWCDLRTGKVLYF